MFRRIIWNTPKVSSDSERTNKERRKRVCYLVWYSPSANSCTLPYHTILIWTHTIPYHTHPHSYHTIPYSLTTHTIPYHTIPILRIPHRTSTLSSIPYWSFWSYLAQSLPFNLYFGDPFVRLINTKWCVYVAAMWMYMRMCVCVVLCGCMYVNDGLFVNLRLFAS